ncbi:MAG: hypothetical protein ACOC1F_12690 [Myxococcota bacterium]
MWGLETGSDCAALEMVIGAENVFVQTRCSLHGLEKYEIIAVPKDGSSHSVFANDDTRFDAIAYHGGEVFYET